MPRSGAVGRPVALHSLARLPNRALEAGGAVLLWRPSVCEIVQFAPQLKRSSLGAPLMSVARQRTASLRGLFSTVLLSIGLVLTYEFLGMYPNAFIMLFVVFAPLISAISWVHADARARHVPLVQDMGLFLWLAWPVLLPWYAVRTRGRHGWPLALVVMLATIAPLLLAAIVEVARSWSGR